MEWGLIIFSIFTDKWNLRIIQVSQTIVQKGTTRIRQEEGSVIFNLDRLKMIQMSSKGNSNRYMGKTTFSQFQ